jgi:glycerol uptake facilitator-like aquaporin
MVGAVHVAVFLIIVVLAASPAYYFLRRTDAGRARGAAAYLSGFAIGIVAVAMLPTTDTVMSQAALLAAFTGPFVGMARARYMRLRRERNRARRRARLTRR